MFIGKRTNVYGQKEYLILKELPDHYYHHHFYDDGNYEIFHSYDFCASVFERVTGIKMKIGTWMEMKLVPVTESDRRRAHIKKIFKDHMKKRR